MPDRPPPDGDPLVLLPGMNCSARLWSPLDLGPTLTVPTLTGPILTVPTLTVPTLTEPTLTAQVDRLLDELPARFALAGLSLGGIVAMALVRRAPERVSWLALLSTNPYAPTPAQYAGWAAHRAALATGASARELQAQLLPVLLSPRTIEERPDLVDQTLLMADEVGAANLDAQLTLQASRVDERDGLRQVRCPTVVIAARDDALCPLERHREIHRLVPGSELTIIDDCAHLSTFEQPGAVARLLAPAT